MIVALSCWFYTLFLFDTLGDSVGFADSYWVLVVMPLMPLVLFVLCSVSVRYAPAVRVLVDRVNIKVKHTLRGNEVTTTTAPAAAVVHTGEVELNELSSSSGGGGGAKSGATKKKKGVVDVSSVDEIYTSAHEEQEEQEEEEEEEEKDKHGPQYRVQEAKSTHETFNILLHP